MSWAKLVDLEGNSIEIKEIIDTCCNSR